MAQAKAKPAPQPYAIPRICKALDVTPAVLRRLEKFPEFPAPVFTSGGGGVLIHKYYDLEQVRQFLLSVGVLK